MDEGVDLPKDMTLMAYGSLSVDNGFGPLSA